MRCGCCYSVALWVQIAALAAERLQRTCEDNRLPVCKLIEERDKNKWLVASVAHDLHPSGNPGVNHFGNSNNDDSAGRRPFRLGNLNILLLRRPDSYTKHKLSLPRDKGSCLVNKLLLMRRFLCRSAQGKTRTIAFCRGPDIPGTQHRVQQQRAAAYLLLLELPRQLVSVILGADGNVSRAVQVQAVDLARVLGQGR